MFLDPEEDKKLGSFQVGQAGKILKTLEFIMKAFWSTTALLNFKATCTKNKMELHNMVAFVS